MTSNNRYPLPLIGFYATLITSIALFVGGFFAPPMGIIDGSILTASGILLGFATIAQIPVMINAKNGVKITHNNTSIQVGNNEQE